MKRLILVACLIAAACAPGGAPAPTPDPVRSAPAQNVAEAGNAFGLDLFRRLAAREEGNVVLSPVSILGAFGPVTAGARGETLGALTSTLRLPGDGTAHHAQLGGLLRQLERSQDGATLNVANALWVQQGFALRPDFVRIARAQYGATAAPVDFVRAPDAAARRINTWVEERTNQRIRDLIPRAAINDLTRLIVTNAVYFLGDWQAPFPAGNTADAPFHMADGSARTVPMMHQLGHVRYAETPDFQAIDLPYRDERLSMTILLPRAQDGVDGLIDGLDEAALGDMFTALDGGDPRPVRIHLPKLRAEASYRLVEPLAAMGMGVAFTRDADFRGIADADLFLSEVVHKTFLRIDEKGTEAAAATGIVIQTTSVPPPNLPVFRADHPFLFLIRDKDSGAILFLGRIAAPEAP